MIDVLWMALRLALAAVLLISALGKLRDPARFAGDIGRYRLLPATAAVPAAWLLIAAESVAVGLLVIGSPLGFWLASALFVVFGVAVGSALGRRLAIPCGCFGGDDVVSSVAAVRIALLLLVALAGAGIGLSDPERWLDGWDLPMAGTLAAGGLILGRLVLLIPDVRTALGVVGPVPAPAAEPTSGGAA